MDAIVDRDGGSLAVDVCPFDNTVALCIDESSYRTPASMLLMPPRLPEHRTHDYGCHRTTILLAAPGIATVHVTAMYQDWRRDQECLSSSNASPALTPTYCCTCSMDHYTAHKLIELRDWSACAPRLRAFFNPTSDSDMNLVVVWLGVIERQAIQRGTFGNIQRLADQILDLGNRQPASNRDL